MKFTDCVYITGESCKKYNGNKNYISTGAVDEDHIDQSQVESVSYDSKPSRANLITDDNSILFAKMQSTKKTLLINQELKENVYSTGFFSVAPKENILNRKCLYHLLASKTFLNQKDKYCSGATQKAITLEGLNKIEINIPKFEEQKSIAKKLDAIKQMISSYNEILNKYDELIKARFIEMFQDEDFPLRSIGEISEVVTKGTTPTTLGFNFVNLGVNFVKIENISEEGKISKEGMMHITEECNMKLSRSQLHAGDILFSIAGAIGRTAIVPTDILPANTNQALAIVRLKHDANIKGEYLLAALSSPFVENQYKKQKKGVAQINLTLKNISDLMIPVPSLEIQKQFTDFAKQIDKSKFIFSNLLFLCHYFSMRFFNIILIYHCIMHSCINLRMS